MTVQQLSYILEVNRTGSISQAAKNLYVSQPSISNAISALEHELGFSIFTRSWQGVIPTERGQKVLAHASHICEHHRLMLDENTPNQKTVNIGTALYLPLCDAFAQLADEYRGRDDLLFNHSITRELSSALNKLSVFDLDVAVISRIAVSNRAFRPFSDRTDLQWTLHQTIPAVARIGPGHRLYSQKTVTPIDLAHDPIVDTPKAYVAKASVLGAFIDVDPDRAILSPDRITRYEMVRRGLGYNIGPIFPEHIDHQYGFRNIPLEGLEFRILSISHAARPLRPEALRYLEIMEQMLPTPLTSAL